jgi:hypothetical protein
MVWRIRLAHHRGVLQPPPERRDIEDAPRMRQLARQSAARGVGQAPELGRRLGEGGGVAAAPEVISLTQAELTGLPRSGGR